MVKFRAGHFHVAGIQDPCPSPPADRVRSPSAQLKSLHSGCRLQARGASMSIAVCTRRPSAAPKVPPVLRPAPSRPLQSRPGPPRFPQRPAAPPSVSRAPPGVRLPAAAAVSTGGAIGQSDRPLVKSVDRLLTEWSNAGGAIGRAGRMRAKGRSRQTSGAARRPPSLAQRLVARARGAMAVLA